MTSGWRSLAVFARAVTWMCARSAAVGVFSWRSRMRRRSLRNRASAATRSRRDARSRSESAHPSVSSYSDMSRTLGPSARDPEGPSSGGEAEDIAERATGDDARGSPDLPEWSETAAAAEYAANEAAARDVFA